MREMMSVMAATLSMPCRCCVGDQQLSDGDQMEGAFKEV
jgi:hypothetical protein